LSSLSAEKQTHHCNRHFYIFNNNDLKLNVFQSAVQSTWKNVPHHMHTSEIFSNLWRHFRMHSSTKLSTSSPNLLTSNPGNSDSFVTFGNM